MFGRKYWRWLKRVTGLEKTKFTAITYGKLQIAGHNIEYIEVKKANMNTNLKIWHITLIDFANIINAIRSKISYYIDDWGVENVWNGNYRCI